MNKLLIIITLILSFCVNTVHIYSNDLPSVQLSMENKNIDNDVDLQFRLSIKSLSNKAIYLPKYPSLGYIRDTLTFVRMQLQRKRGEVYTEVTPTGLINNAPIDKIDTLTYGKEKTMEDYFALCYRFTKGQYRLRVLCGFSSLNNFNDVYSNWVYFNCTKDVLP